MSNPAGSSISDLWLRHFNQKPEVSKEEFVDVKNDLRQVKNALYLLNSCIENISKELERFTALMEERDLNE